MASASTDSWVRAEYKNRYCDKSGRLTESFNIKKFRSRLAKSRPAEVQAINDALKRLDIDSCNDVCQDFETNDKGVFTDPARVHQKLSYARPDLCDHGRRQQIIAQLQEQRKATKSAASTTAAKLITLVSGSAALPPRAESSAQKDVLKSWIRSQYYVMGFQSGGFIGWKAFEKGLQASQPNRNVREIHTALQELRQPDHELGLEDPNKVQRNLAKAGSRSRGIESSPAKVQHRATNPRVETTKPNVALSSPEITKVTLSKRSLEKAPVKKKAFGFKLDRLTLKEQTSSDSIADTNSDTSSDTSSFAIGSFDRAYVKPNFDLMDQLLPSRNNMDEHENFVDPVHHEIEHAPLISASIVEEHSEDLIPQYGLLGEVDADGHDAKMFHNTNVPFSTFICGVQGSGKSHSTSCMLENALISTPILGHLQSPASALVFSYGEFGNGGAGFTISEAASLAAAGNASATDRVKKVTVLTSPSNPAINEFYRRIPGIKILPFKLKAKSLDISTLLTLMAVNEKAEVPLYMAKVESILRTIATESKGGVFHYDLFKERLALENFDPKQTNMLEMRLGLLESFLDKEGNIPEPQFRPCEITIIDLSDPFVTPSTACILFKLGLDRFMQSNVQAKMVVLDEAHKYMLDNPGSKLLTSSLATLVRLQRHKAARVVIATQEPTVSTDLIALCSVTIIHRFTSPTWYASLKRHICAMDSDKDIMREIESLNKGVALVYAPNAVLGKSEDGTLIKAAGRLLRVNVRSRITRDGGESIMAV